MAEEEKAWPLLKYLRYSLTPGTTLGVTRNSNNTRNCVTTDIGCDRFSYVFHEIDIGPN